jgi:transcriptional regulator with XRE-family HTH domain
MVGRTMAVVKPRLTFGHMLVVARQALQMSQREFGPALGASHRTASRWDAGNAQPTESQLRSLVQLLAPVNPELATEAAAHIGETLENLGLAPYAPQPAVSATAETLRSAKDLVDIVVCAAAEAADTSPRTMRPVLYVAVRRARQVGLTLEQIEQALAPEEDGRKSKAKGGRSSRDRGDD